MMEKKQRVKKRQINFVTNNITYSVLVRTDDCRRPFPLLVLSEIYKINLKKEKIGEKKVLGWGNVFKKIKKKSR